MKTHHHPIHGATRERAPVVLTRRTAVLIAACLLAAGCTASTWLNFFMFPAP